MRPRGGRSSAATDPSCGNWELGIVRCATAPVPLVGSSLARNALHRRLGQRPRVCTKSVPRNSRIVGHKTAEATHLPVSQVRSCELRSAKGCSNQALPAVVTSTGTVLHSGPCLTGVNTSRTRQASRQTKIIMTASLRPCQPACKGPKNTAQVDGTTAEQASFRPQRRSLQKARCRRERGAPNGSLVEGREKTLQIVRCSHPARSRKLHDKIRHRYRRRLSRPPVAVAVSG